MGEPGTHLGKRDRGLMADAAHHLDLVAAGRHGDLILAARVEVVPHARAGTLGHRPDGVRGHERFAAVGLGDADLGRDGLAGRAIAQGSADDGRRRGIGALPPQDSDRQQQGTLPEQGNRPQNLASR